MKNILFILCFFSFAHAQAQRAEKKLCVSFTRHFAGSLSPTPQNSSSTNLSNEITNLGSKLGAMRFDVAYDILRKQHYVASVGVGYSFLANNLRNGTIQNNTYTYRFESSNVLLPLNVRYYLNDSQADKAFFLKTSLQSSFLLKGLLRKRENIFDNNHQYLSTTETVFMQDSFNKFNVGIGIGCGLDVVDKYGTAWIAPSYTYQLKSVWNQGIKTNIGILGITVGAYL